jgi:ribonuclease HI
LRSKNQQTMCDTILKITSTLLMENLMLTLVWVPSHIGLVGNEHADKCTKGARIDVIISDVALSIKEAYSIIRRKVK